MDLKKNSGDLHNTYLSKSKEDIMSPEAPSSHMEARAIALDREEFFSGAAASKFCSGNLAEEEKCD